VSRLLQNNN